MEGSSVSTRNNLQMWRYIQCEHSASTVTTISPPTPFLLLEKTKQSSINTNHQNYTEMYHAAEVKILRTKNKTNNIFQVDSFQSVHCIFSSYIFWENCNLVQKWPCNYRVGSMGETTAHTPPHPFNFKMFCKRFPSSYGHYAVSAIKQRPLSL